MKQLKYLILKHFVRYSKQLVLEARMPSSSIWLVRLPNNCLIVFDQHYNTFNKGLYLIIEFLNVTTATTTQRVLRVRSHKI